MVIGPDELIITDNPAGGGTTYVNDIDVATGAKVGATITLAGTPSFGSQVP